MCLGLTVVGPQPGTETPELIKDLARLTFSLFIWRSTQRNLLSLFVCLVDRRDFFPWLYPGCVIDFKSSATTTKCKSKSMWKKIKARVAFWCPCFNCYTSADISKTTLEIKLEILFIYIILVLRQSLHWAWTQAQRLSRLIYKMHIKDPDPDSSLLQGSCLYGALLCEHVYGCNGCESPDNAPRSIAHTLKNLMLWSYRRRKGCNGNSPQWYDFISVSRLFQSFTSFSINDHLVWHLLISLFIRASSSLYSAMWFCSKWLYKLVVGRVFLQCLHFISLALLLQSSLKQKG